MICIPCRRYQARYDNGKCADCGGGLKIPPRNWSPPKRHNKKAWREIERGNWLWDGKRVRRAYKKKRHYHWHEWITVPNATKGARGKVMSTSPRGLETPVMPGGAKPHWLKEDND